MCEGCIISSSCAKLSLWTVVTNSMTIWRTASQQIMEALGKRVHGCLAPMTAFSMPFGFSVTAFKGLVTHACLQNCGGMSTENLHPLISKVTSRGERDFFCPQFYLLNSLFLPTDPVWFHLQWNVPCEWPFKVTQNTSHLCMCHRATQTWYIRYTMVSVCTKTSRIPTRKAHIIWEHFALTATDKCYLSFFIKVEKRYGLNGHNLHFLKVSCVYCWGWRLTTTIYVYIIRWICHLLKKSNMFFFVQWAMTNRYLFPLIHKYSHKNMVRFNENTIFLICCLTSGTPCYPNSKILWWINNAFGVVLWLVVQDLLTSLIALSISIF